MEGVINDLLRYQTIINPIKKYPSNFSELYKTNQVSMILPTATNNNSGGHRTAINFLNYLNDKGINTNLVLDRRHEEQNQEYAEKVMRDGYKFKGKNIYLSDYSGWNLNNKITFSKNIICTDRYTPALGHFFKPENVFYFVQDYEPGFHSFGSLYAMVESSYHDSYKYLCASDWIGNKLKVLHNINNENIFTFNLGIVEDDLFKFNLQSLKKSNLNREGIICYIRSETPRRCSELLVTSLMELNENLKINGSSKIKIKIFGSDNFYSLFSDWLSNLEMLEIEDLGIIDHGEIKVLAYGSKISIAFSGSNYNLVNNICAAQGCYSIDIENNLYKLDRPLIKLVKPGPKSVMNKINQILNYSSEEYEKEQIDSLDYYKKITWPFIWEGLYKKTKNLW